MSETESLNLTPKNPRVKNDYDRAIHALQEAKEAIQIHKEADRGTWSSGFYQQKAKYIHIILLNGGYLDVQPDHVKIEYNGVRIYIRADKGPFKFAMPLERVDMFGSCDGSETNYTYYNVWRP